MMHQGRWAATSVRDRQHDRQLRMVLVVVSGLLSLFCAGLASAAPLGQDPPLLPDPDRSLLSTGQTIGYRGNRASVMEGNRDDGDLIRGRLFDYDYPPIAIPSTQEENLVVDRATGLMWIRDLTRLDRADGEGARGNVVLDGPYFWDEALAAVDRLEYGGFDDWRLPNVNELQSLVDYGIFVPAIDTRAFPNAQMPWDYVWTSTTAPLRTERAYYVNFFDGHAHPWPKAGAHQFAVRPVRSVAADEPVALMKTGQSTSYQGSLPAQPPGSGDDGQLQLGLEPRYRIEVEGEIDRAAENRVIDLNTGLEWIRDPRLVDGSGGLGGDQDLSLPMSWQTAIDRCNALAYDGADDWRLPNIRELVSIVRFGSEEGPFDREAFPHIYTEVTGPIDDVDSFERWLSSTTTVSTRPNPDPQDEAWYITASVPVTRHHVEKRTTPSKARRGRVRCVRDAQPAAQPALYLPEIRSASDWNGSSLPSPRIEIDRVGKFLLPAVAPNGPGPATRLPFFSAFQDVSQHPLHYDFLRAAFPERYGAMSLAEYSALTERRASREIFAGGLRSFALESGEKAFGWEVYVAGGDESEQLSLAEVEAIHLRLKQVFRRRPLVYSPSDPVAEARARAWSDASVPIAFPAAAADPDYEAYTPGEAYGVLRLMRLEDLETAALSWQDILILDGAPTDLEGIVAAIVTGGRQGELSHLAVRTARRATPNAYIQDAHEALREYEGKLVRLTLTREAYTLTDNVDPAAADAYWSERRPEPVVVPALDPSATEPQTLAEIASNDAGGSATRRFGAKTANLARLYTFLPAEHQVPGLGIPFTAYLEFMASNTILDERSLPAVERSFADYVTELHADERFLADPAYRAERLEGLREAMRDSDAEVPDDLEDRLAEALDRVFGSGVMVRFRSSSNAEDGLAFNGAGLYDSTSVCALDGSDGDSDGPSRCDPNQPKERGIKRGLRKVWASLWSFRAWEERSWYGIDPHQVGMAVLVTPAFPDERANGVAFTGNPLDPSAAFYLVNVQEGDASVVLPDPGTLPERNLLAIEDGQVSEIRRMRASTLLPAGEQVMSDEELRRLGSLMSDADARFPIYDDEGARSLVEGVMLDFEFKIRREDGQILIKQVRPFLPAGNRAGDGFLRLNVPEALPLCAGWRISHEIREELRDKLWLDLPAGELRIPLSAGESIETSIFGALRHGPDLEPATPLNAGKVGVEAVDGRNDLRSVEVERSYRVGSALVTVSLSLPDLRAGEPNQRWMDADETLARSIVQAKVEVEGEDGSGSRAIQVLAPCGLPGRAVERLRLPLEPAGEILLETRYDEGLGFSPQTAAELVQAWVVLPDREGLLRRLQVKGYDRLVYDAGRHNWDERYLLRFGASIDSPYGEAFGIEVQMQGLRGRPEEAADIFLLDEELRPLGRVEDAGFERYSIPGEARIYLPSTRMEAP